MRKKIRTTKKIMLATFVLPIILCTIIILGFCGDFLRFSSAQAITDTPEKVIIKNIYNHESLTLSLIGIAISVWIGLNIYNILSKEELLTLLDSAQKAAEVTERVYTEMLKSKFRMSSSSTASEYFAIHLDQIDPFPAELSEQILELEDLFQISYRLYGEGISSIDNFEGESQAKQLKKAAKEYKKDQILTRSQYSFLAGYACWRWADFLYYQAKYDKNCKDKIETAKSAIKQYKKAGYHLFSIINVKNLDELTSFSRKEQSFLAYLANDIGSAYIDVIRELSDEELSEAIFIERAAVKLSSDLPSKVREKFLRNLGSAYEQQKDMDNAFLQYKEAYQIDHGNWRTAHCIASWYRKQAMRYFYPKLSPQEHASKKFSKITDAQIKSLSSDAQQGLIAQLERAVYWYSVKQVNFHGQTEPRLIELNGFLYRLTKDKLYCEKEDFAKKHEIFANEILKEPTEKVWLMREVSSVSERHAATTLPENRSSTTHR
ncbi:MAG: hypothetical protein HFG08_08285 [Oscillibacter sp.]|jgi:hypothetical protein|nr:hypothetical protein [Oscillibacter sp.]